MSDVSTMSDPKSKGALVAFAIGGLGVIALIALIARELFAPAPKVAADVPHESEAIVAPAATTAPPPVAPSPVVGTIAHAVPKLEAPAPEPSASAAPSDVPRAAQQIADALVDPRAKDPSNVVQNWKNHSETFGFEVLAPFRAAEITRDKKDPKAWTLNGMMGPKTLDDLAPPGGVHQAAVQKDDQGQTFATWFAIDSGPLAPAFATQEGDRIRVISRAYLEANRGDYPPSMIDGLLGK